MMKESDDILIITNQSYLCRASLANCVHGTILFFFITTIKKTRDKIIGKIST